MSPAGDPGRDPQPPPAAADPPSAAAELAFGNACMQAGRYADAAAAYARSLAAAPGNASAHNNLAVAFAEQHLFDRAIPHYREALRLDPGYAEAHYNLGNALRELARYGEAVGCYDRALALRPGWPGAHCNRGLALAAQGRQGPAEAAYRAALALDPGYAEAHNNLGLAVQLQGRLDEARAHFDRAVELAPEFASPRANRAQLALLHGDFQRGWPEYEWRWRLPGVFLPRVAVPMWDGSPLAGRTLLLRAEQGFGDTIQFVRFAAPLARAGATAILECQPALASLLAKARGVHAVVPRGSTLPRCDFQIPLASLPGALGVRDLAGIPAEVPYLAVDQARRDRWRTTLAQYEGGKVGIAWRGNPKHPQDCHRSIPQERVAALGAARGVTLVSLQAGERARGIPGIVEPAPDPERAPLPFEEWAALIASLDLVITCDSVMAHLAGALGVPVWIALPLVPDWRWLLGRDDSPWYPTARLFRQTRLDDWDPVFARMAATLRAA
jgi:tetratricopeptide (TPR) repeat protein